MALVYFDRVQQISVSTGTGSYTLDALIPGFQGFGVCGPDSGNTLYYCATDVDANGSPIGGWEVGIGRVVTAGAVSTVTRDQIFASSNSNGPVNWAAGTRRIFLTQPADALKTQWTNVPFNAANFKTRTGTAVWTVNSAALYTNRYLVVGGVLFWDIYVNWGATDSMLSNGSSSQLSLTLPGGLTPVDGTRTGFTLGVDAVADNVGLYTVGAAAEKALVVLRIDAQAFPAGRVGFFGMLTIALSR